MAKATVVLLIVDSGGTLVPPLPARAEPESHFAFVLVSQHATDKFDLKINFDDIVLKQDKTLKKNPFKTSGPLSRQLNPGEIDLIKQKMRDPADFVPAGALPYTTYKYTVILKNMTSGGTQTFDPDIDVPPA